MRTSLTSLAAALLLVGAASAAEPPAPPTEAAPMPLRSAVQQGLLRARGHSPTSYTSVRLELINPGAQPIQVDLCGSHLTPQSGSKRCQRLGLGPVITPGTGPDPKRPPGTIVVTVAAGRKVELHLHTVCLDAGTAAPTNQVFVTSAEALPPVREKVLRWWADHPETKQGDVNSAIWRNEPEVQVTPPPERTRARAVLPLRGTVHGGTAYLLRGGGLVARGPDGIERFLATGIADVFPVDGALYAVAEVGVHRELWRYVETGDELWKRVAPVPEGLEIRRVAVLPGGGLLVAGDSRLLRLWSGESALAPLFELPEKATDLTFQLQPHDRLRVAFTQPSMPGTFKGGDQDPAKSARCELLLLDLGRSKPPEKVKSFWNVAQIVQGPTRTFGLTNAGNLRVLRGDSFHDQVGPTLERLVHVGREHLWALARDGNFVCLRLDTGTYTRVRAPFGALEDLRFDDALFGAALRGGSLVRIDPVTGDVKEVEPAGGSPSLRR